MKRFPNILKTVFFSSLLGYASSLTAAYELPSQKSHQHKPAPIFVTLESPCYSFEVNFAGMALQPYANNLDYAAEALPFNYGIAEPALSPNWIIPVISPSYQFGFDLGIAGIFHSAKSSLMLDWERFHSSSNSASITVADVTSMVGTFFEIGPDASPYKQGTGNAKFQFDEVNLDYGTFVHFGKHLNMNLFAGVGFTRIYQRRFTTISDLSGAIVRTLNVPSKFLGAGPQVGFDFNCKIVKGFQFVGNTKATLFVGTFKNNTTFTTASPALVTLGDPSPNIQTTTVYNKGGVVPGLEGKLGLAYEYPFKCHYMFKVEAGYQAQIYINSIRSVDLGSEVALADLGSVGSATTGVYARTFQRTVSDFALAGPYAKVDFGF